MLKQICCRCWGFWTRLTFIIDENGLIIKAYPKVKPDEHGEEVLKILRG